jgi:CHAT domain-containing protein/tetratricopeptide (TPR) repeat protein
MFAKWLTLFVAFAFSCALAGAKAILAQSNDSDFASLTRRVVELQAQGKYREAVQIAIFANELAANVYGPDSLESARSLNNLGTALQADGQYERAEPNLRRALELRKRMLRPNHPDIAISIYNLAALYVVEGRNSEAEPLLMNARDLWEKALGPDHANVGTALNGLATAYEYEGRYAEAEPLLKRALSIWEKALGPTHPEAGRALNNLAQLYKFEKRYEEAEPLFLRAISIWEGALGTNHPDTVLARYNLAAMYVFERRYVEARPLMEGALAAAKEAGAGPAELAASLNGVAMLYVSEGRYAEALPLMERALTLRENALSSDHPDIAVSQNNIAVLYQSQGRYREAETFYLRALDLREKVFGPDHPDVGATLNNLANLFFIQGDLKRAADYWRRSTSVILRRVQRGTDNIGRPLTGERDTEAAQLSWQFRSLIKTTHRLNQRRVTADSRLAHDMFETAQWALASKAAQSVAQMAARSANGDATLAPLVRERQDLVAEWQRRDEARNAALAQPPEKRNSQTEAANFKQLGMIDARIAEIDGVLKNKFPEYASLVSSAPLPVETVQGQLRPDEALVLFLDTPDQNPTPEETFVWVVTKTQVRWVRSDRGTETLTREVSTLRCGLDEEEWATPTKAGHCADLLGMTDVPDASKPLPFDAGRAYGLYLALFGRIEDLIQGKRLLIVPSGPLASLPFHVLVTQKPKTAIPPTFEAYRAIAWLARRQAITVLPAVSSLKALRLHEATAQRARDAYAGYGDPVLNGDGASCRTPKVPDTCAASATNGMPGRATLRGRGGRRSGQLDAVFAKGAGLDNVLEQVRALCPLPDTAYEIKCVAEGFKDKAPLIRLEKEATKASLKAMNENGQKLARYRVLHFATHGLVAGDVATIAKRQGEPALVLTPPDKPADPEDNGLLLASDVAGLKLNADWVVLSACNTAAGDKTGGEALSGLARAFFYAGARGLLVSHWPVYSDAAVQLTTRTFTELERDPKAGRAEAFQRSMIALMNDTSQPDNAHPAVWAPFVVVGEGAK